MKGHQEKNNITFSQIVSVTDLAMPFSFTVGVFFLKGLHNLCHKDNSSSFPFGGFGP